MNKRIDFNEVQPTAYEAMDALDQFVKESSIDKSLKEFIKIRASQINGCAYCVDAHSRDARRLGESEQRIFLVSAWREVIELVMAVQCAVVGCGRGRHHCTAPEQLECYSVDAGVAVYNPDRPDRPVNSPAAVYQIEPSTLALLRSFDTRAGLVGMQALGRPIAHGPLHFNRRHSRDDGRGFEHDLRSAQVGMGLHLVERLAQQIDGEVTMENKHPGTRCRVGVDL